MPERGVGGYVQPAWARAAFPAPTESILDVLSRRPKSTKPTQVTYVEVRVFADAEPEAMLELTQTLRDAGVPVEPTV